MKSILKAIALALAVGAIAYGDGNVPSSTPNATPVAVTSTQAGTICCESAAAAAAQATCTVAGVAGQFFYVTLIEIQYGAIAAPSATLLATTTSNLGGIGFHDAAPAATFQHDLVVPFAVPQKSAAVGTSTVITGNAGVANISQDIKMCGFYAQ